MEVEGRSSTELCKEAYELLQAGRISAAVERLEKALEQEPNHFDAHHYLGIAYGLMGKMEEAEQHLRKAVEILPDSAPAHYNLGLVLHYRGNPEEAVREFRTALELNPHHEPVRSVLRDLGEPVEQMVEEIMERKAEEEGERKTFAEAFAEAPWAAVREKEAEAVPAPAEEAPQPRVNPVLKGLVNGAFYGALIFSIWGAIGRFFGLKVLPEAVYEMSLFLMFGVCLGAGAILGAIAGMAIGITGNPVVGIIVSVVLFSLDKILALLKLGIVKELGLSFSIIGVGVSAFFGGIFGYFVSSAVASALSKE